MTISDFDEILYGGCRSRKKKIPKILDFLVAYGVEIRVGELWPLRVDPQWSNAHISAPMSPTELILVSNERYLKDLFGQGKQNT